jgi:hypothetical protein
MNDQVKRIGETLKSAFAKKTKMPLRRHRDDDYWDEIAIDTEKVHLRAFIVPRFKTSGLSGDEWRISAKLEVHHDGHKEPVVSHGFHRMHRGLCAYGSHFIYQGAAHLLGEPNAFLVARRKGVVLTQHRFPYFGDAAMGMGWHILTANEGRKDMPWHHLTDEEERQHCQQVGCPDPPVNVFHLKKIVSDEGFKEPKYDFEGQYVWYCARHTTRGDCGFEDADANLELVAGSGVAREHADDESPAAFGGVIEIDK